MVRGDGNQVARGFALKLIFLPSRKRTIAVEHAFGVIVGARLLERNESGPCRRDIVLGASS
jgi:hypothetical protein